MTENVPSPESPADPASLTPVARLLRPQGRRGELLAEPLSDIPELFTAGLRVSVAATNSSASFDTTIESHWSPTGRNVGRIVLKLADVDSISAAELLAGRELLIPSANLPPLEPDTWFVRDLIGCQLFDNRTFVGEISGVEYSMSPDGRTRLPDTAPLLEVTLASDLRGTHATSPNDTSSHRAPALIPFIKTWLDSVDLDEKRVVMHLPPGLLDLNDEPH